LDSSILSVLCKKVAEDTAVSDETADKAWKFYCEWALLMIKLTPQPTDYKVNDQLRNEEKKLVTRMADFVTTVL
jgi:hypothetical protein